MSKRSKPSNESGMQSQKLSETEAMPRFEAGFEATRRRQLTLGLLATPAERLKWLEEVLLIAHRSGALERRRQTKRTR